MGQIKFNETDDYQHISVFGTDGVFTSADIKADSLPPGFHKYTLLPGNDSLFGSVSQHEPTDSAGSLVTREELDLGESGERSLGDEDWSFPNKDFEFEAHFGRKLAFDTQVELAEAKRDAQLEEVRSKKRDKNVSKHQDKDL